MGEAAAGPATAALEGGIGEADLAADAAIAAAGSTIGEACLLACTAACGCWLDGRAVPLSPPPPLGAATAAAAAAGGDETADAGDRNAASEVRPLRIGVAT